MGKFLEKLFGKKKKEEQINKNDNSVVNNENQNNIDNIQPITFNQSINTEIESINTLGFVPMEPVNNIKPVTNVVQNIQEPIVNNPIMEQSIIENSPLNNMHNTQTITPLNNSQPELNVNQNIQESTWTSTTNNQMVESINFNQQPQISQQVQELNVIPTMGPTPSPIDSNQNNVKNQNM